MTGEDRPPLERDVLTDLQAAGWHVIRRAEVSAMKVRAFDTEELLADTVVDLEAVHAAIVSGDTETAARMVAVVLENLDVFTAEVLHNV